MKKFSLSELSEDIRNSPRFTRKRDICLAADYFSGVPEQGAIWNGDDAAAIPDGDGYLLLAAEGVDPDLIDKNPYLAGRSAVLANINDIYAMGGRPVALVNVLSARDKSVTSEIFKGMKDNAERFKVPIVGGHTLLSAQGTSLAVAILGKAKKLITSFEADPGDDLLLVYNPDGKWMADLGFWNSTSEREESLLTGDLELFPQAAEGDLAKAGKDVSMAGIIGTALMIAESSHCGVTIDLELLPAPPGNARPVEWLLAYFSYGFLLAVKKDKVDKIVEPFLKRSLEAKKIGSFQEGSAVVFKKGKEENEFWNWNKEPFTGFK